jgi:hypothetical protein
MEVGLRSNVGVGAVRQLEAPFHWSNVQACALHKPRAQEAVTGTTVYQHLCRVACHSARKQHGHASLSYGTGLQLRYWWVIEDVHRVPQGLTILKQAVALGVAAQELHTFQEALPLTSASGNHYANRGVTWAGVLAPYVVRQSFGQLGEWCMKVDVLLLHVSAYERRFRRERAWAKRTSITSTVAISVHSKLLSTLVLQA